MSLDENDRDEREIDMDIRGGLGVIVSQQERSHLFRGAANARTEADRSQHELKHLIAPEDNKTRITKTH